jgi:hypothetical protein
VHAVFLDGGYRGDGEEFTALDGAPAQTRKAAPAACQQGKRRAFHGFRRTYVRIASMFVSDEPTDVRRLRDELPRSVALWLGGRGASRYRVRGEGVLVLEQWADIDRALGR